MRAVTRPAPLQLASSSFSPQPVVAAGLPLLSMSVLSNSPLSTASSSASRHSFIEMDWDEYTIDGAGTPIYSPVVPPSSTLKPSLKKQRKRRSGFLPPRPLSPVREASDDDNDAATLRHFDHTASPVQDPASSHRHSSTTDLNGEIVLLPTLGSNVNYYRRPSLTDDLGETDEIQAEMSYVQKRPLSSLDQSKRSSNVSISTLSEFPIPPPSATSAFIDSSPMSSSESDDDDGERGFEPPCEEDDEFDLDQLDTIVVSDAKQDGQEVDLLAGIPMFPGSGSRLSTISDSAFFPSNAFLQPRRAPIPPPPSSSSSTSTSVSPLSSAAASPPSSSTSISTSLSTSPKSPATPLELDPYDKPLVSPGLRSRNHGDWRRAIDDMYSLSNAKVIDALSQSQSLSNSRPSSPTSSVHTFGKQVPLPRLKNSKSVPSLRSASTPSPPPRSSEDSAKTSSSTFTASSSSTTAPKIVFPDQKYTGTNYTYYSREQRVPSPPHSTSRSLSSSPLPSPPRAGTPTPSKRGVGTGVAVSGFAEPAAKAYAVLGLGVLDSATPSAGKKWHLGFGSAAAKRSVSPTPPPSSPRMTPTSLSHTSKMNNNKTASDLPIMVLGPAERVREREQRTRGPSSATVRVPVRRAR